MKTLSPLFTLVVGAVLVVTISTVHAQAKAADPTLLAKAKISHADAEKTALQAVPNATVKESELEEEDGGMRWSFDLKTPGSKKITDKVIENKVESDKKAKKRKSITTRRARKAAVTTDIHAI